MMQPTNSLLILSGWVGTHMSIKVVFGDHFLQPPVGRSDEGCGVQVVEFVEGEECREVGEVAVSDPILGPPILIAHLIYYVVAHFTVFSAMEYAD